MCIRDRIKEQRVNMELGTFHCGRLTRTQPPVYLQKRLFHILGGILLDGGQDALILAEKVQNFLVAAQTQSCLLYTSRCV